LEKRKGKLIHGLTFSFYFSSIAFTWVSINVNVYIHLRWDKKGRIEKKIPAGTPTMPQPPSSLSLPLPHLYTLNKPHLYTLNKN
jgi:hypothetical protein